MATILPIEASTASRRRSSASVRRPSIGADKLGRMTMSQAPKPGADFNLVFIGAGGINFVSPHRLGESKEVRKVSSASKGRMQPPQGSVEGPWDHSFRLEHKLGPRLKVIAIIDPAHATAAAVLERKRASFVVSAYANTRIYASFDDFMKELKLEDTPHAFIVGSPPGFRGCVEEGRDIEMKILAAFPDKPPAMFIEKPISTHTVAQATIVGRALADSQTVVSVGYVLRYLKVVQKMRSILEDNNLHVMATNARYVATYSAISNPAWWNKSKYGGPIVEQGTHFVDLSRYFGGDVDLSTVRATSLEWFEEAGQLSSQTVDEEAIPEDQRIPRVTSAIWKYANGGVGSLTHSLNLQGFKYATELEVFADGYKLCLVDPYNAPTLRIRSPLSDDEEVCTFDGDDPYFSEVQAFVDAVDPSNASGLAADGDVEILSTFDDSLKSYALSWAIREASERSAKTARIAKLRDAE